MKLFTISGRYASTEDLPITSPVIGFSWTKRLKGFAICLLITVILGIAAVIVYFVSGSISTFAIIYSFAVICGLGSTFFLVRPMKQLKNMFDPTRCIATIVFLACLAMTLVSAIVIKIAGVVLVFVILQFLALLWYTLSYIPYARDLIKRCCRVLIRS